ncbi:MAG: hypothetical protein WAM97_09165 [Acidimicrobiales bacterium]
MRHEPDNGTALAPAMGAAEQWRTGGLPACRTPAPVGRGGHSKVVGTTTRLDTAVDDLLPTVTT